MARSKAAPTTCRVTPLTEEERHRTPARPSGRSDQRGERASWSWQPSDRSSAKNPLRSKQQHEDQNSEGEHALGRRREQKSSQGFGHADQKAAQQRTSHRTEAAGNDDDEGQQRVSRADDRRNVDDQRHHDAGGADAGGANAEGQRIEPLDIEANDERAGIVVRAGAYRFAN